MMCSTSIGAPPLAIDLKIRLSITSVTHCWIQNFPTNLQFCLEVSETLPQILHFPKGIPGLLVVKILQDHPESKPQKNNQCQKSTIQTGRAIANDWPAHWRKLHFKCGTSTARRTPPRVDTPRSMALSSHAKSVISVRGDRVGVATLSHAQQPVVGAL